MFKTNESIQQILIFFPFPLMKDLRLGDLSIWSSLPQPNLHPRKHTRISYEGVPSKAFSLWMRTWWPEPWRVNHLPNKTLAIGDPAQAVGLWQ